MTVEITLSNPVCHTKLTIMYLDQHNVEVLCATSAVGEVRVGEGGGGVTKPENQTVLRQREPSPTMTPMNRNARYHDNPPPAVWGFSEILQISDYSLVLRLQSATKHFLQANKHLLTE